MCAKRILISKDTTIFTLVLVREEKVFTQSVTIKNGTLGDFPENIKGIIIPEGITTIEENAFEGCVNLTSITLPCSLKHIRCNAFAGCPGLREIVFPDSLEEVDCRLDGRGVSKITLSEPSPDELIENLKQGYAMDFYYKGEYRDDHWD